MQYEAGYRDGIREFAEYLKKHSCSYDLDSYHSFDAINIEDLDDLAGEFFLDGDRTKRNFYPEVREKARGNK